MRNDIPEDVHRAIQQVVEYLRWVSSHVTNENYRNDLDRDGLAINCEAEADLLEALLHQS